VVCREACTEGSETAKSGTDEQNQAQRIMNSLKNQTNTVNKRYTEVT
jgi:hypothetical protein